MLLQIKHTYVAAVPNSTSFQITDTQGSSTGITLTQQVGSALFHCLAYAGSFTISVREQAGATGVNLTMATNTSSGSVSSATGIQAGQRVIGSGIPADTFVLSVVCYTCTSVGSYFYQPN